MSACRWCRGELVDTRPPGSSPTLVFCSKKCRQTAFRLRKRSDVAHAHAQRMRFAYGDPPYPGLARRYYEGEPTYAGEVDHVALIEQLDAGFPDGWALSTSAKALRHVLPLCPDGARVCAWVKPIGVPPRTHGIHNNWEPLIVCRGRQRPPGRSDWLRAQPARFGGELMGRKPIAFAAWLFGLLGAAPGDELVDLYPGTGIIGRAWESLGGVLLPSEYSDDDASSRGAELRERDEHVGDVDGALDPVDRADEAGR